MIGAFESRRKLRIFLFTTTSRTALGPTQPPIQWERWVLSFAVKRPAREADHSPPSTTEVKNALSYTSTPPIRLNSVVISLKQSTRTTLPSTFMSKDLRFGTSLGYYAMTTHSEREQSFHTFLTSALESSEQLVSRSGGVTLGESASDIHWTGKGKQVDSQWLWTRLEREKVTTPAGNGIPVLSWWELVWY
jgi:hypothetical protein